MASYTNKALSQLRDGAFSVASLLFSNCLVKMGIAIAVSMAFELLTMS